MKTIKRPIFKISSRFAQFVVTALAAGLFTAIVMQYPGLIDVQVSPTGGHITIDGRSTVQPALPPRDQM
jgi:hypothetical protein